MLNYEKRLVVVTYCIHFEVLVQLDAEDSVAQAALVFAVFANTEILFVVRYFLCS